MIRSSSLPIKKLRCLTDGFTVEESSLIIQNLGLPEGFSKHFLKEHKKVDPKEGEDYTSDDAMVTG
jgi:hypothetical protein